MALSEEREGLWDIERQSYKTEEDHIDTAGAVPGHTSYLIKDLVEGNRRRWQRLFGDVDDCDEFIDAHPQLRGISKRIARVLIDEKDPVVQANAIEDLGMELIGGKGNC